MRLSGIATESHADGPGLRYVLFTQGCLHQCPGCHNPESWEINAGKEFSVKQIIRMLKQQKKKIQGITFSGGEPFLQACELAQIALAAHQIGWDVVTYTGYTYEQLIEMGNEDMNILALILESDLLIDGKYINKLQSKDFAFRGSSNQRIIDIAQTQEKKQIVLWQETH